jgi:hypothetical protein
MLSIRPQEIAAGRSFSGRCARSLAFVAVPSVGRDLLLGAHSNPPWTSRPRERVGAASFRSWERADAQLHTVGRGTGLVQASPGGTSRGANSASSSPGALRARHRRRGFDTHPAEAAGGCSFGHLRRGPMRRLAHSRRAPGGYHCSSVPTGAVGAHSAAWRGGSSGRSAFCAHWRRTGHFPRMFSAFFEAAKGGVH